MSNNKKIEIKKIYVIPMNGGKKPQGWPRPSNPRVKPLRGQRVKKGSWYK